MKDFWQFILILVYWGGSFVLRFYCMLFSPAIFPQAKMLFFFAFVFCIDILLYRWFLDHWQTRKLWGYIAAVMISLPALFDIFLALFLLTTGMAK